MRTKYGKTITIIPNERAIFQVHVAIKNNEIILLFKIAKVLNDKVPFSKTRNGLYNLKNHSDVFKWFYLTYTRYVNKDSLSFLLNNYPEIIENILDVTVLPSKNISLKKFKSHFSNQHKGKYHETFIDLKPKESEIYKNFYEIRASLNGLMLNDAVYFLVNKNEYLQYKKKYGNDTPFVIENFKYAEVS
jgi:hypothetical protein